MNSPNVRPSDRAVLAAVLDPVSQGAATVTTGWVSLATFAGLMAVLQVGAIAAGGTVDAKLQQASDGAGTGAKDITGKAITQLTDADDNKQVILNVRDTDLDVENSFTHVRLSVTVAVAASLIAASLYGFDAKYAPAADAATVDEVVG